MERERSSADSVIESQFTNGNIDHNVVHIVTCETIGEIGRDMIASVDYGSVLSVRLNSALPATAGLATGCEDSKKPTFAVPSHFGRHRIVLTISSWNCLSF